MAETTLCRRCGTSAPCYWYCDRKTGGPWCDACFDQIECLGKHEEGCATKVFESRPPPKTFADGWRECREAAAAVNGRIACQCALAEDQLLGKASAEALRMAIDEIRKLKEPIDG